jgi:hypothetical protein
MISDARGGHVSPGIYTEEKDVIYSVKSLGITSLGLVGETLYGPAFEDIEVKDWGEYVDNFGGTSPELFKGTGLPKYELPYIAKSYLEESKRLHVVKVLGLSGYDAGEAFLIKQDDKPIAILRSKMVYSYNAGDLCATGEIDTCQQVTTGITVGPYTGGEYNSVCSTVTDDEATPVQDNMKFGLTVQCRENLGFNSEYTYNISLNPNDTDYIYKVLSSSPDTGTTPIYIEAVYEGQFDSSTGVAAGACTPLNSGLVPVSFCYIVTDIEEVETSAGNGGENSVSYTYTLRRATANELGHRTFIGNLDASVFETEENGIIVLTGQESQGNLNGYYTLNATVQIEDAYSDFREMYRPAQTPWIVSDIVANEANGNKVATARKLFKFITISDGNAANYQIKVSIANINVQNGTFDVVVRDFNDTDANPVVLEKFSKCSLVQNDASFIAHKIGTADGLYVSKSKYIAVQLADGEDFSDSIPAGFLGYPMPDYGCGAENRPQPVYNTLLNTSIKPRRQYFGLTNNTLDIDLLKYKGKYFYDDKGDCNPEKLTNGFHMDAILSMEGYDNKAVIDGVTGFTFTTVSKEKVGSELKIPRLINAPAYVAQTIYKDMTTRKFTVYFYGGFDGWDVNRESRTNTDDYKSSKYTVKTVNGTSKVFTSVEDNGLNQMLNLPNTAITSDYYAYLAGYRVFANPQDIDINVFATPGIDWYNNTLLVEEVLDIIEDSDDGRGGDALYVINSPRDADVLDVTYELEDTDLDSSYAATFYPWVLYYDQTNKRYIELPVTKDVVRNLAQTDNTSFPWFAPAGMERGNVNCVKASYKTTLTDEDVLYNGRINPVKSFSKDGVKIWGNKTLYSKESPLNRINVRRLMIRVKKLITDAARHLIFEQYDDTLEKQFRGLIEPILANVRQNRGIYDYRIITEVTEETRDQHILPAKVLIKPTPALEYISISFVVYPESVQFENE